MYFFFQLSIGAIIDANENLCMCDFFLKEEKDFNLAIDQLLIWNDQAACNLYTIGWMKQVSA